MSLFTPHVLGSVLALALTPARATVPMPTYAECGTPDRPDLCPADLGEDWALLSYVPAAWKATTREAEWSIGTGLGADRAWRTTTGRTDVVIAVLDSGILWDQPKLWRKHYLNAGELPLPQDVLGSDALEYDFNGDGLFNIEDWADDPRVDPAAGVDAADTMLDPSDLIATFSDGIDDDGDGYTDDISGWDFLWNDNDPYDDTRYDHGTYEGEESVQEGDDEYGGVGVCPSCMLLSVRVSDSFVADGTSFGAAALFAVDSGADVLQVALGDMSNPSLAQRAVDYAWEHGVLMVGSAADETAYHPNAPASNERVLYVHAIRHDEDDADESTSFLAYSNCTNHGVRLDLSAPSGGCSSGATAMTAGAAGLLLSAAKDRGIKLAPGELFQLLTTNIVDIDIPESRESGSEWYPSKEGWDRYFGPGRLNAAAAVEAVAAGQIPPMASIDSPRWYELVNPEVGPILEIRATMDAPRSAVASWTLAWGAGDQPDAADLHEIASGTSGAAGVIATLELATLAAEIDPSAPLQDWALGADQIDREDAVNRYTVSLRLSVTDTEGRVAQARKAFYLHADPDALPGFPLRLGPSLEASPTLYDIDGDGVLDIIQGDADGMLHVLHGAGDELPGFPVQLGLIEEVDPDAPTNLLAAPGFAAVAAGSGPSIVSSAAVADLDGDGSPEIVAATLRGLLYVIEADGSVRPGFPVEQEPVTFTDPENLYDEGFFGSPALGDLDNDGQLDIVIGGMDQRVYVWDADGQALPGWPLRATFPGYEDQGSRIVGSPALGDLDEDGVIDVVIGTAETLSDTTGALYAFHGQGTAHPDGPNLPGWPIRLFGAYTQALPYVGEGIPGSPALADIDGDGHLEVTGHTMAGDLPILRGDGTEVYTAGLAADQFGPQSNLNDAALFPLINSSSFGDLDGDGLPDLVTGGIGAGYALGLLHDGKFSPFDDAVGAWSGLTGTYLEGWPRVIEDIQFFMNPAIADLDDDGRPEVLAASGGFLLHAWDVSGEEPAGWPKFTGQWVLASPAVGDVDGDGLLDVVVGTRQGWLFAWTTSSPAGARVEWAGFGHDPAHTRNYSTPLPEGYNTDTDGLTDGAKGSYQGGCGGCAQGTGRRGDWLLSGLGVALLLGLRRRR
jgi:hypothetical protein